MRLNHLLRDDIFINILNECEEFLSVAESAPLRKTLPCSYEDAQRVKVRKRKKQSEFNASFNEASRGLLVSCL